MAFPPAMTAALSGATIRQLGYWRRPGRRGVLLVPEVSVQPLILYSFRDVLALRSFVYLRRTHSLQAIRTAVSTLRHLGEGEHLSTYRLVSTGDSIVLVQNDELTDLAGRPGHRVIATLLEIVEPFSARDGVVVPALFRPRTNLEVDPDVRGGVPVIAGTRVPYDIVAGLVNDGMTPAQIRDLYPSVSDAAALDAVDFGRYVDSVTGGRPGSAVA
ncbi:MAG TPA: DUF433 domain-containing protein [Actinomycetes bacterium]|nr:DUF433 domain-containing protein [Actinomycetes bacterium]